MPKYVVMATDIRNANGVQAGTDVVLEVIDTSYVGLAESYIMEKYDPEGAGDLFKDAPVSLYTDCIVSKNYGEGIIIPDAYMNEGTVEPGNKIYRITIVRIPDPEYETNLNESTGTATAPTVPRAGSGAPAAAPTAPNAASMVGGRRRKTHHRSRHSHRRRSHRR
jgi:hypothetical protein